MKKLTTILSAAALLLPSIGLYAQESDAVISQSGSSGNGFFAYADYYQYIGVGAQGDLVAKESITNYAFIYEQMNKLYSATPVGTIFKTTGTGRAQGWE
ncbi:MAG TPA: hypothetical protein PK879_06180 [Opitutaceae bacterium]|nr:hypothetical protein [Opitutaceae bacterium]HPO00282.1 hypothetical protein [Opitutaceae bacterium]